MAAGVLMKVCIMHMPGRVFHRLIKNAIKTPHNELNCAFY